MDYGALNVIEEELKDLENFIVEKVESPQMLISSAVRDLINAGGKRIRPALTILFGKALGYKTDKLIPLAASMEIIHMATLIHDDIVDDSSLRRGMPTIQSKYGKDVAVFTGDYLFSKAFLIVSEYENTEILKRLANGVKKICEGEIEQYESRYSLNISFLKYIRRIKKKTGMLMSISCIAGAFGKAANPKLIRNIGLYGMYLGLAFQITDDILDFMGDIKVIGKPVGNDIRQGVFTLPLIYALKYSDKKDDIYKILESSKYSDDDINKIIDIVKKSGGIEFSKKLSERYVNKGIKSIQNLKDSVYKKALCDLIYDLNSRKY